MYFTIALFYLSGEAALAIHSSLICKQVLDFSCSAFINLIIIVAIFGISYEVQFS